MLKKRVITGLWGIPLLFAAVWFDKPLPWFTLLMAIWGLLAVFEFYKLAAGAKLQPLTYFGLIWTLFFIISPHFNYDLLIPLLLTSAVVLPLLWLLVRPKKEGAFIGWAWTLAGILYLGWLLSHWVALRGLDEGRNWVFFALATDFASDTTAFFVGRALGRHKLAPNISPGKTWEGTIGGLFGAVIVSLLFTMLIPSGYWRLITIGLLVSIFGQLGDLAESLLKRNLGVKDSGRLFPGHGGALDRLDSVVLAGVVVYYCVLFNIP